MAAARCRHVAAPSTPSPPRPPWKEPCSNKKEKKRLLSGRAPSRARKGRKDQPSAAKKKRRPARVDLQSKQNVLSLVESLEGLTDPRVNRRRRHLLMDIVVIGVLAVVCNADTWKDMHVWAQTHEDWLAKLLPLPNGIPSRDTLRRTISRLNPQEFQRCFLRWLGSLRRRIQGVIAIDGKTARRSMNGEQGPLHLVSAWASQQRLTLGQVRVSEKSNEITAIPELLKLLELKGAIVTIDAMGCQKEIAAQIMAGRGDYVLAVKENQPKLYQALSDHFLALHEEIDRSAAAWDIHQTKDKAHGRMEQRTTYVVAVPESFSARADWKGMRSWGQVIRLTEQDGKETSELRYFISSLPPQAERIAEAVRSHWGIENSLHWVLDVTFREDESRIRKDQGVDNVGWLRRVAISLLQNDTTIKDSIRAKRIRAGYDITFLDRLLQNMKSCEN